MKYRYSLFIPLCVFVVICISSCDSGIFHRRISEGIIEFKVTYPKMDSTAFIADFVPDKMIMKFKKNKYVNELSAGMGMYKTLFISNSNDYIFMNLVKLINKKYAMQLDRIGALQMNKKEYPNIHVIPIDETKIIAGYTCRKALVVFNTIDRESFYVYYTTDINIYDPNWSNPFSSIGGVLLEYQLTNFNMDTKFVATSVTKADIDDDIFEKPKDYEDMTYEELFNELNEVFSTFN